MNNKKIKQKEYRDKQKSYQKEYQKKYRKSGKKLFGETIKGKEYQKEYREMEKNKTKLFLKKYGITNNDYNEMFDQQKGCCKICFIHQKELKTKLFIDHDHKTGKVRGLLCNSCNLVLGFAKDNINILEESIKYLKNL
jgi:hypothetical protein